MPSDVRLKVIGATLDSSARPVGKWTCSTLYGKEVSFFPVFSLKEGKKRHRIPLVLKYTFFVLMNIFKLKLKNSFLAFHRVESAVLFLGYKNIKVVFVHSDLNEINTSRCSDSRWRFFPFLAEVTEKTILSKMAHVYAIGNKNLKGILTKYPELKNKSSSLSTWYDEDVFYPKTDEEKSSLRDEMSQNDFEIGASQLVTFVGRLEEPKDPVLAVKAFSLLNQTNPDSRMIVVGDGSLRNKLIETIETLGLNQKVLLLGERSSDEVAAVLQMSDLYLMSSKTEGMPFSVIEALACGVPVISTDVGSVSEVVLLNKNGLISNTREPEELSKCMEDLLSGNRVDRFCVSESMRDRSSKSIVTEIKKHHDSLEACF